MAEQHTRGARRSSVQRQSSSRLPEQRRPVVKARPVMIFRAASAVLACAAAILYLYWQIKSSRALYWLIAATELCFFVYYWCIKIPLFNLAARQTPQGHDALFIKQRLLEQLFRVDDVMACMESWFLEAGPGEVKSDNLRELFAYAIWYKSIGEMEAEGLMPDLDDIMTQLEAKYGRRLPPGYNPDLCFMSHLWEPLRHMYRPLLFYIVMELLTLLCHVALWATGFRLRQIDGITYYTYRVGPQKLVPAISTTMKACRSTMSLPSTASFNTTIIHSSHIEADSQGTSGVPIVFLHGVGAGLLPYLTIIFRLAALGQPMILPHSKHVSMRLVSWIPTVDDMADATAAMLAVHGYSRAAVVAHSYGTMVASRLVMKYPHLVHSMCLTDPVCFAMFMPNLLRNFLYARHSSGCWWLDVLLKLVASEVHVCANFSRKFFWSSINLWDEHIPERTLVVLGGKDILSPAVHVDRWLREHTRAQVMYEPTMRHAGMLLSMEWQAAIVTAFADIMQQQEQQPASDIDCVIAAIAQDSTGNAGKGAAAATNAGTAAATALSQEVVADGVAVITAVARAAGAGAGSPGGGAMGALRHRYSSSGGAMPREQEHVTAAAVAPAGGSPPHACSHPYNRLCSDCLSSYRASQAAGKGGSKQQQQPQQQFEAVSVPATTVPAGKLSQSPAKQQLVNPLAAEGSPCKFPLQTAA